MDAVRPLSYRNLQASKRPDVVEVYQLLELLNIASFSIYKQLFSYYIVIIDPLVDDAHIITVLGIACQLIALLTDYCTVVIYFIVFSILNAKEYTEWFTL